METGKKYKLADECITPGGRNMTRDEDAIIEAKKYYRNDIKCYDAFLHGVEWAEEQIANVWHDASEMPKDDLAKDDSVIIYQDKYGNCRFITKRDIVILHINWECFATVNVRCWAYISDLLPKGGKL